MTELQERLLIVFKVFDQFCRQHNLRYYAAYGTCLGAVRHHGFIPWDDDMDVYMMRADYERLLSLRSELHGTNYRIWEFRDGHYPAPFAKYYSTDCSMWEQRKFPMVIGPWVDIFPIDRWNENNSTNRFFGRYVSTLWNYRKALAQEPWSEIWYDLKQLNCLIVLVKLVKKIIFSPLRGYYFRKTLHNIEKIKETEGDLCCNWGLAKGKIYRDEWFKDVVEMPFEDTVILCPNGYDELLTVEYGDYMTPPSVEHQRGGHPCYYVDIYNKKSLNEIREEIKKTRGHEFDHEKISIRSIIYGLTHRKGI